MKLLTLPLLIAITACTQQPQRSKHTYDPIAKNLNDSAISLVMDFKDYNRAILLLDKAIEIDSDYIVAFANKLTFQLELNQLNKALATATKMNQIRPSVPDYYVTVGILTEKNGDTISSINYFKKANFLYDRILDTMNKSSSYYDHMLMNYAINLILLGQPESGYNLLKDIYNRQRDDSFKSILKKLISRSRLELIDNLLSTD